MARRKISEDQGIAAVEMFLVAGRNQRSSVSQEVVAIAVRFLLEELAAVVPGNSLEVRVPPFGAVQCLEGPRHTRGTPPNVIETDAATWIKVAMGEITWQAAVESNLVSVSGMRADLSNVLPLEI